MPPIDFFALVLPLFVDVDNLTHYLYSAKRQYYGKDTKGNVLISFAKPVRAAIAALFISASSFAMAELPDSVTQLLDSAYDEMGRSMIETDFVSGDILCENPEVSLPRKPNIRGGRVAVMLSCPDVNRYIQVEVRVHGNVVMTKRSMQAGETLTSSDIALVPTILTNEHRRAIRDVANVEGMTLLVPVDVNQVVTENMVKAPRLVERNDVVTVRAKGDGFNISRKAVALSSGALSEVIRVRMDNKETINGRIVGRGMLEAAGF